MMKDERAFRLRPRKPRRGTARTDAAWAVLFKSVVHYARSTRVQRRGYGVPGTQPNSPHAQRCAVRATYSRNNARGQWRAHGRYIARSSATGEPKSRAVGFDANREDVNIEERLNNWQTAGDERLWKIIISPEFAERLDMTKLVRQVVQQMEVDLDTPLEWVAISHFNTDHPHVHVALRGIRADGQSLRLDRDYVKSGIRSIAAGLCTNQLGYRSELDAHAARQREVSQCRVTSLDRLIRNRASLGRNNRALEVQLEPRRTTHRLFTSTQESYIAKRLMALEHMGLATRRRDDTWEVKTDFENVLRSMQQIQDRQKTLAQHGAAVSDNRLPVRSLSFRERPAVEGRVLVHGEDEDGRTYLMLEGTDACIHHIRYTPEIEQARARGLMKSNSFVRLRTALDAGKPILEIDDLGGSEALLRNRKYFRECAMRSKMRSQVETETVWDGWIGRYQASLRQAIQEVGRNRETLSHETAHKRGR